MFRKNALIIVGAGASCEFGLPSGNDLRSKIASNLNLDLDSIGNHASGDKLVYDALVGAMNAGTLKCSSHVLLQTAQQVRRAVPLARSIDHCIHMHGGNKVFEMCGKVAIVRTILSGEKASNLHISRQAHPQLVAFETLNKAWCNAFFPLLTEDCTINQIEERLSHLTFVVFNYDRCVEQFLFHGLKQAYGIPDDRAAQLVSKTRIFHPYGRVGALPWQGGAGQMEFGGMPNADQLRDIAEGIKTFTEGVNPAHSDIIGIREALANANTILFLGFAFHQLNMDLLFPQRRAEGIETRVYATAHGLSKSDVAIVENRLAKLLNIAAGKVAVRPDMTANAIFGEYGLSLALDPRK